MSLPKELKCKFHITSINAEEYAGQKYTLNQGWMLLMTRQIHSLFVIHAPCSCTAPIYYICLRAARWI